MHCNIQDYCALHIPQKTYAQYTLHSAARLFLHRILPGLGRLLYLDADLAVNCDMAELYALEMGDYALAGVHDGMVVDLCTAAAAGRETLKTWTHIAARPGYTGCSSCYDYCTRWI